ncbi:MAG: B12-binding domain-containing radical SAM protein [Desulfobacterales bacterium]|nr:B12-binding domain-containing radical SAM protein [Desulfobacterales bacterium]
MQRSFVLINPPISLEERYGKDMKQFGAVTEPLGIAYIAGYLESQNIPVRIIDAPALNLSIDAVVEDIAHRKDAVIGVSMLTPAFGVVRNLCHEIKKTYSDGIIVLGGPHCTVLPEKTLEEIKEADIVCIGEGELTMAAIAVAENDADLNQIKGICFRHNGSLIRTENRPFIKDLDTIPPPSRHLLPMEKYHLTASRVSGGSYCPTIIVARGCPFACTYCSRTFGRTFRVHSINRIITEIETLIANYQISQINIEADTLTVNKAFLYNLCNTLIKSGISEKIKWTCESRVDTVDEDALRLMKRAGCWQISYGVETGSQRLLDLINKSVTLDQVAEVFRLTKKVGITIRGFFMLGLPTETRSESIATIAFAKKIDPLWAQFTITVPYPGTKMFNDLDRAGQIRTYDWTKYNTWSGWKGDQEIPYIPEGRTMEELTQIQKQALRNFYIRPRVIFRFIRTIRSFYEIKKYFLGFWVLVKSRLSS